MRSISIYALTRNQNTDSLSKLERQLSGREYFLKIREWELQSMKALVRQLESHMTKVCSLRFFYSYQIPKLGKEFDLLQIKDDQIINIELKSGAVSEEAIRKQLMQNRYYLSVLGRSIQSYTYISSQNRLVRLTNHDHIAEADWTELCGSLQKESSDYQGNIDDLFQAELYLISPITEPARFLEKEYFLTIPCGIILTEKVIITVCLEDTAVLADFKNGRVRNFWTFKRTRFILQILYRNASLYLQYLRIIDKKSDSVEKQLHISTKNQELIELLELEKSLVYFSTSLRSNELVLEKMLKIDKIKQYPEDEELLDDVIIENKQAIEMADIYSNILSGTMDAYASVISNNLNIVMKVLAIITIVMSIPTMIFSAYGMNLKSVGMPFADNPMGFLMVILLSLVFSILVAIVFRKKDLF